jgi:6-pyruvoyltetrahydropterin/6-carboxytetrahydropterin synthase
MGMLVTVYRKEHFNAAHRLYNPAWDNAKNNEVFGLCNNPNYHGHNYDLVVKVTGPVDPDTGYVINLKTLSDIIKNEVLNRYDHQNLNLDTDEFNPEKGGLIPTAENIAVVIWQRLRKHLQENLQLTVILYETERNFVEYSGN